jgi:peptidoglycan/LPS O-acetylase OafA/YrhL
MNESEHTPAARPPRLYGLDWLRVLLVGLVFLAHSLMPFNSASDWAVMNDHTAFFPAAFVGYLYQWVMPLFFVVSGASTALALPRGSNGEFITRRARRLALPYMAGVLLLSPVHDYYAGLNHGRFDGGFLAYCGQFFGGLRWDWSLSFGLPGNHLWFLQYLFWFSLAALPIFRWLHGVRGQKVARRLARMADGPGLIILIAAPVALVQAALRPGFHEHTGWSDTVVWFLFFTGGYLFIIEPRLQQAVARFWPLGLPMGAACMACAALLFKMGYVEQWELNPGYSPGAMAYEVLRAINTCAWVVFYLGMAMRFCTRGPRMLLHANEGVLPFYMLHQPAIVITGFYLFPWAPPLFPAWAALFVIAFTGVMAAYLLLIYPFNIVRALFGLAPRRKPRPGN